MSGQAELVQELKSLRKGRGLLGNVEDRVGPVLRSACAVSEEDGMVAVRRKVASRLTELAGQLPEDLRVVVLAAFAIGAEARQPLYQDRVKWAAEKLDRDPRTVRRRADQAIDLLAELATGTTALHQHPGGRWHTASLAVALVLDQPRPTVLEQRRIVADGDDLRSVDLAVSLPSGRSDLTVTVLYGGDLVDRGMEASDRWGYGLELRRPLSTGESCELAVLFQLPSAAALRPHMASVPRQPCDEFDLRIRFGEERPSEVCVLDGAFQRDVADPGYRGRLVPVEPAGEVHRRFSHLTPGMAYGMRWERP
ncbi:MULTISPECIES: hypothetical protein [unclassified Amycolatopsis]|uniref:hypothetical protein n=1 Tax=unclassified Amycolatopsis TaxID=2618356 RepID=UPI0028741F3A|nr:MULTISPECIES: hypothetical protein [unclassified Amycolatopsis]MDS0133235.1 hypothetical protein [Amycolatopsis sp. 505]MDS0146465.1 hypothetical protein [Amycolatopsis sp. CM201R]